MKKVIMALGVVGLCAVAGASYAGNFASQPVLLGASWAQGSVVSARTSGDANQWIGCRVNTWSTGSETGMCWAYDSTGASRTCTLGTALLRQTAKAINQTSFVRFEFSGAACTRLDIINSSNYTNY